tara:strand:+ start:126 stop:788 length:663 start_codon:yes stop_codon:yes gene_type:complete
MLFLESPILCLVTDRLRCSGRSLEEVVENAVDGGVDIVQLREKDLEPIRLFELACRIRSITEGKAKLFINDRIDIAMASGADGVQLGENSLQVETARRISNGTLAIGRSVHRVKDVLEAYKMATDLVVLGAVFTTKTHPEIAPIGHEVFKHFTGSITSPVLGIGGMTTENVGRIIEAGASGAGVITAISEAPDPTTATLKMKAEMVKAWNETHGTSVTIP